MRWTPRRVATAAVFLSVLLGIQVLLPVSRVVETRPIRFGWHMYAHGPERVVFRVITSDGSSTRTTGSELFARRRPELVVERWVPEALCELDPEVVRIEVEIEGRPAAAHECD